MLGPGRECILEQIVTVQLFGLPYTFKAESEGAKAREVADYLVSEVAKVEGKHTREDIRHVKTCDIDFSGAEYNQ